MPTAQPGTADRFFILGFAGLAVTAACLAIARGFEAFSPGLIIGIAAGFALCIYSEIALIRGVYRYLRAVPCGQWNVPPYSYATKAFAAINGFAALSFFAGFITEFLRNFGVNAESSSLLGLAFILFGLILQMVGQAQCLKRLAKTNPVAA